MAYTIHKAEFSIVGVAGHDYWVVKDDAGKILTEIHGMATSTNGIIKEIGYLPSDKIKTYIYGKTSEDFGINSGINLSSSIFSQKSVQNPLGTTNPQKLVFSGTASEVYSKVAQMVKTGHQINELDLGYPFLGFYSAYNTNSNAVNHTLGLYAGLADVSVGNSYNPGEDINLLDGKKYYVIEKGVLQQLSNTATAITHNGTERAYGDKTLITLSDISEIVIDGTEYLASSIEEAYELAHKSVTEFITNNNQQIKMLEGGISYALNQTFVELGTLAANGQAIDTTKILQKFAVNAGIKALPLWGRVWVGDEAMTIPSNDNRQKFTQKNVA